MASAYKEELISKCMLLEIKVYRDRVDRHPISTKYEKYLNNTDDEEPSQLVGTLSDQIGFFYTKSK